MSSYERIRRLAEDHPLAHERERQAAREEETRLESERQAEVKARIIAEQPLVVELCGKFHRWAIANNVPLDHLEYEREKPESLLSIMFGESKPRTKRTDLSRSHWVIAQAKVRSSYNPGGGGMAGDAGWEYGVTELRVGHSGEIRGEYLFPLSMVEEGVAKHVAESGIPWTGDEGHEQHGN